MPKTFNSSFAGRFLEASWRRCHSSSVFSLSQFVLFLHVIPDRLDDDEIRSLCGALAVFRLFVQTKISLLQLIAKWMFGNVNWYFLMTHYSKRWLKTIFSCENTSVLIILATTVCIMACVCACVYYILYIYIYYIYIYIYIYIIYIYIYIYIYTHTYTRTHTYILYILFIPTLHVPHEILLAYCNTMKKCQ